MTIPTIPPVLYQVAFNAAPNQSILPPWWTDISSRVQFEWTAERGRQYELDQNETGEWRPTLANPDGALDPSNTASPYAPNVVPYRQMRIKVTPGPNLLTPDQATAGAGTGYGAGPVPASTYTTCGAGYPLAYATSGSAYQGSSVYQVSVPNGTAQPQNLLNITYVDAQPGLAYAAQVQARMLSTAQNLTVSVAIDWYNSSAAVISTTAGTGVALTGGSSTWVQLTAAGTAPAGTAYCQIRAVLATTTTATASAQFDGAQFEQNGFATLFQVPNTAPANLLPRAIATGGTSIAAADSVANWWTATGIAGQVLSQAVNLTAAPSGHTTALAWQSPVGTTNASALYCGNWLGLGNALAQPDIVQVTAGTVYSASAYLSRASSADTTVQVTVGMRWFDVTGNLLSASGGTAVTVPVAPSWVRGTCSATAPAGAAWGRPRLFISTPATTTAINTLYATGWQFEAAGSPSTWGDPGTVYQIINGFVERWPQTWSEQEGTYGTSDIVGPDQLTALAQYTLADPFIEEILSLGPNFFYTLSDPAGASSCADATGNRPPAPIENSPFGPGSLVFGSSVTSTSTGGLFVGSAGPVATFNNNANYGTPNQLAETFINIARTTVNTGPPVSANWTRLISFRAPTAPAGSQQYFLWSASPPTWQSGNASFFYIVVAASGHAIIGLGSSIHGFQYTGTTNLADGNWHQIAVVFNYGTLTHGFYVDGTLVASPTNDIGPTGCVTDVLGCTINAGASYYEGGHIGDLAHAIEIPQALTTTQVSNLYNSWRSASSGESTGARINRILKWIGWSGPTSIATGSTSSMGPATDLTGDAGLDAINAVVLSENGNFYASNQGILTFQSRSARYNQTVPAFRFGEQIAAGEYPFEILYFDDDPSHIANNVQVTQYNGSVYTAIDTASTALYFPRVYQRTVNATSVTECTDAANYLLSQYKGTGLRVSQLRLHPSAVPGLFNVCLNLEIGTLIQVNRRPNGAPMISFTGFVEKVAWDWDPDNGEVFVDLQCSPANKTAYWTLASLHTTLNAQAASGQNQATINALPDAAYNALGSSLSQNTGYQLVFDPGTPIQETMTLAPGGIPATNIGYATATLTFTSNFAHTHALGSTVCEVLPTGVIDPTTYDLSSILGAAATTLNAPATSGTNTLTVNALPDAKTNPANADWTTGDLIWIGVDTADFEGYNLLSPNVSTAGEGVLPLATGTAGTSLSVTGALGTPTVTASATAWQGTNVWQVSVSASGTSGFRLIRATVAAVPGQAYTASFYVRSATSGANPQVAAQLLFLTASGGTAATTTGTSSALTGSATATWTRVTVTATAPATAVSIQAAVVLAATGPGVSWSFQADGMQVEANASASAYQTCPQILSVGPSVAGYSTVTLTLAQNLASSHVAGEYVCDPLPPGTASPAAVPGMARIAY